MLSRMSLPGTPLFLFLWYTWSFTLRVPTEDRKEVFKGWIRDPRKFIQVDSLNLLKLGFIGKVLIVRSEEEEHRMDQIGSFFFFKSALTTSVIGNNQCINSIVLWKSQVHISFWSVLILEKTGKSCPILGNNMLRRTLASWGTHTRENKKGGKESGDHEI